MPGRKWTGEEKANILLEIPSTIIITISITTAIIKVMVVFL
jgi:hypothetical protein